MKQLVSLFCLALLLHAESGAADDGSTLLCGLSMGSRQLAESSKPRPEKSISTSAYSHLPGPQRVKLMQLDEPAGVETQPYRGRSRLPAAITIASVGCTWR